MVGASFSGKKYWKNQRWKPKVHHWWQDYYNSKKPYMTIIKIFNIQFILRIKLFDCVHLLGHCRTWTPRRPSRGGCGSFSWWGLPGSSPTLPPGHSGWSRSLRKCPEQKRIGVFYTLEYEINHFELNLH